MRLFKSFLVLLGVLGFGLGVRGQADSTRPLRIAVFAPVYLDSAFIYDTYKLGNRNLPKYILPGLDFYNGVMMAVDSLNTEHAPLEVLFYDSKSAESPIQKTITDPEFSNISLIIAAFNTRADMKPLADFALQQNIPLISATYPNDGGLTENPFFVLINPRLVTHIEAVYKYLQRNYPIDNIVMFRKKGNSEDAIQSVLNNMNRKTPGIPLKLKTIELADSFTTRQVTDYLDSNRQNIVVCGTLNETFGKNLTRVLGNSKNYASTIIGMPTWDALKDISKDLDIVYSTPFNPVRSDKLSMQLIAKYKTRYLGRPSDMFFRGFESMYHFSKLLLKHQDALIDNLSDKEYKLFNEFDIQPVHSNIENSLPDYLENKKLYFIRKVDGRIKSVN